MSHTDKIVLMGGGLNKREMIFVEYRLVHSTNITNNASKIVPSVVI